MLPFGMLNAFLVVNGSKAVLVDTGLPNSAKVVAAALTAHGLSWRAIQAIILTHAHIDHAGGVASLMPVCDAPIIAHEAEVPYLSGRQSIPFLPTGLFGRAFSLTGLIQQRYPAIVPDILVQGTTRFALDRFGIEGELLWTPGHTPGSLSLVLGSGDVVAGDLVSSGILLGGIAWKGHPKRPPFEEDPGEVARQLRHLLDSGCNMFHLGHGGPLRRAAVEAHIHNLQK